MLDIYIIKEILISFIGTSLALLSAGVIWILKSAYEKHKAEVLALAKFERIHAQNITMLKDNFEFLERWINALKVNKPFSYYFADYIINEEETYKISNLNLITKLLSLNYKLQRTNFDFQNIYKNYWEVILKIDSIPDKELKAKNLDAYNNNLRNTLQQLVQNYKPLKEDIINIISLVRSAHRIRKHSLFGYIGFLFKDIFPKITDKTVEKEKKKLLNNIKSKEKNKNRNFEKY